MVKRRMMTILACILLIAGIGLFSYPYVAQWDYDRSTTQLIHDFQEQVQTAAGKKPASTASPETVPGYLEDLYTAMQKYNREIYETGQSGFKDAYSYEPASFDLTQYGFKENMVGYIEIPKMKITLPIYLGATKENMKLGAVHLTETSLPIGGEDTNCVIAAHRGSRTAMFRDIHDLERGDEVYITNPWQTLIYRVSEIKIIYPHEIQEVKIQHKKDLLTLFTCHPLRSNAQRYVVYCQRVS